jgi:hypothetical protein
MTTDTTIRPALLDLVAQRAQDGDLTGIGDTDLCWAFRAVHPDLRSRNGFRYPWPGKWATAPGPFITENTTGCPQAEGDGLCVAKTVSGAGQGGIPFRTVLIVGYRPADVLGSDDQKLRVRALYVADVADGIGLLRGTYLRGAVLRGADLRGADLGGAYLRSADLRDADLRGADLRGADLGGAYLGGTDLRGAVLRGADLRGTYLRGADLRGADLRDADLGGAYLRGADLGGAYLGGADLRGADLGGAVLRGARYDQLTLWPAGFDPVAAGAVRV